MVTTPRLARILSRISPGFRTWLASVTAVVDDSEGWRPLQSGTQFDKTWNEQYAALTDALEAWRKNPIAKRIVALTTSYVVSDGITISSQYEPLQKFITKFWDHPKNRMDLRLAPLCDELTRAGELFPVLNRNAVDGMSYVRLVPAAEIDEIKWTPGDYEDETAYHQLTDDLNGRWWTAADAPGAETHTQVMLHYAVNRPVGCVRGEGDLSSILPWLQYYSQWLEDRVRLNWATRVFLWFVKVPTNRVKEKQSQYRTPPDPGSIIVHDDGEEWQMQTPSIGAKDASADGRQLRIMVATGAGYPLHMLSEAEGTNLATAESQAEPTARSNRARQKYFTWMLSDLTLHAYEFWRQSLHPSRRPKACTHADITATTPEIIRTDNAALASAGAQIVQMLTGLRDQLIAAGIAPNEALNRRTVELAFRFAGEVLDAAEIDAILAGPAAEGAPVTVPEKNTAPVQPAPSNPSNPSNESENAH